MAYFVCDTSTYISRKLSELPDNFLFSSIVLMELMQSASDETQRKVYEQVHRAYAKDNSLIVPDEDDWLTASKVLFSLYQARRRRNRGLAPRLKSGESETMILDVLIAVSARRWDATVITENWGDFKAIQRYCKFKLAKGSDFFKR